MPPSAYPQQQAARDREHVLLSSFPQKVVQPGTIHPSTISKRPLPAVPSDTRQGQNLPLPPGGEAKRVDSRDDRGWLQVPPLLSSSSYPPRGHSIDDGASGSCRFSDGYTDHEPLVPPEHGADDVQLNQMVGTHGLPHGRAMSQTPSLARDTFTYIPGTDTSLGEGLSSQRLSALEEIDGAQWSRFHVKLVLIAAVGFFTDAYDIFSINIASIMVAYVYSSGKSVALPQGNWLKAATPIGTLFGQLVFGWLADRVGRKRMYGIELIVIIIATFGLSLTTSNDSNGGTLDTISIAPVLLMWRLIMGFGIGGDYPLSAVITSEFAGVKMRGRMMTLVFSSQGWGQITAAFVGYLVLLGFQRSVGSHHSLHSMAPDDPILLAYLDMSWRTIVGLGGVPAVLAVYFRLTIPETPRFTMDIERNVKQAREDIEHFLRTGGYHFNPDSVVIRVDAARASPADFWAYFGRWENAKLLLGCAYSWFAIDVTFYGVGLNTDSFFKAVGFTPIDLRNTTELTFTSMDLKADSVFQYFLNYSWANMFLSGVGLIPGYYAAFLLIDNKWVGRKRLQMGGFIILSVLFTIMGGAYKPLVHNPRNVNSIFDIQPEAAGFLVLLLITSFFQNCGPNTTTFVVPGELFPTRYRSTAHGISAACGKAGAIFSQFVLAQIAVQHAERTRIILFAFVPFTAMGALATLLLKETRGLSLETLSGEDQKHFVHGPIQQSEEHAKELEKFMNIRRDS